MKINLRALALLAVFCFALNAEAKNRRPASGDWMRERLKIAKDYWWKDGRISTDEAEELVDKGIESVDNYFTGGTYDRHVDEFVEAVDKLLSNSERAIKWTVGEGKQFLDAQDRRIRDFYGPTGEGRKYLEEKYGYSKNYWSTGEGKQLLDQHVKERIRTSREFWTTGPGGTYATDKTKVAKDFWTGPGKQYLEDWAKSEIDTLSRWAKNHATNLLTAKPEEKK